MGSIHNPKLDIVYVDLQQHKWERSGGSPVSCRGEYSTYLVSRFHLFMELLWGSIACGNPDRDHLPPEKPGETTARSSKMTGKSLLSVRLTTRRFV